MNNYLLRCEVVCFKERIFEVLRTLNLDSKTSFFMNCEFY